ncbi:MAG: hypothetical protein GEU28_06775 [Dehalococcoidia bacterium]|nr:hypothetical protein [Dehalococcoidia bacterium]
MPTDCVLDFLLVQLAEELQIPSGTRQEVEDHYQAIADIISRGRLRGADIRVYPQGSAALGTTVKPVRKDEFDLDVVVQVGDANVLGPEWLNDAVFADIESHGRYKDKTERLPRCLRISYAGRFHLDVVPAIPDRLRGGTALLIPSADDENATWRRANPLAYRGWFKGRSSFALGLKDASVSPLPLPEPARSKSALQIVVQLLKRHHQYHLHDESLRTPSVVLTTIAAAAAVAYNSVAEAFDAGLRAVSLYAAMREPISIPDPAVPDAVVNEKWGDRPEVFQAFKRQVALLFQQWSDLRVSAGQGVDGLSTGLAEMFGEEPVNRAVKAYGSAMSASLKSGRVATGAGGILMPSVSSRPPNPQHEFYGDATESWAD